MQYFGSINNMNLKFILSPAGQYEYTKIRNFFCWVTHKNGKTDLCKNSLKCEGKGTGSLMKNLDKSKSSLSMAFVWNTLYWGWFTFLTKRYKAKATLFVLHLMSKPFLFCKIVNFLMNGFLSADMNLCENLLYKQQNILYIVIYIKQHPMWKGGGNFVFLSIKFIIPNDVSWRLDKSPITSGPLNFIYSRRPFPGVKILKFYPQNSNIYYKIYTKKYEHTKKKTSQLNWILSGLWKKNFCSSTRKQPNSYSKKPYLALNVLK